MTRWVIYGAAAFGAYWLFVKRPAATDAAAEPARFDEWGNGFGALTDEQRNIVLCRYHGINCPPSAAPPNAAAHEVSGKVIL